MVTYKLRSKESTTNELPGFTESSGEPKERSKEQQKPTFRLRDKKKEKQSADQSAFSLDDYRKKEHELVGQAGKGFIEGLAGTYGDILDIFGLQSKEMLPGERAVLEAEHAASPSELAAISDADDILPRYSRLPSSKEVGSLVEKATGIGEPKSAVTKAVSRGAKLAGGGAVLGAANIGTSLAAGGAGQIAEELGAPGWVQALVEIGTFLKGSKGRSPVSSKSAEVEEQLKKLRQLGYSEEDITLAKSAAENKGWLKKTSKMTSKAEESLGNMLKSSEEKIGNILGDAFPGLKEGGIGALENEASSLYEALDSLAKNVVVEKPESFVKHAEKVIERMRGTLANTPQEKEVISVLENAMEAAVTGRGAEDYIRFYKGLNQIGKWGTPKEREYVFSNVKDAIKQTLRDQGPQGKKVADSLEDANKSWMKYLGAKDASELIAKAVTDEGMNFPKLSKLLENPDNAQIIKKAVGEPQASNLKQIAKSAGDVTKLQKAIEGGLSKQIISGGQTVSKVVSTATALATGNFSVLIPSIGVEAARRLATKSLIDPKFQNIQKKLINAVKKEQWDSVRALAQQADKLIDSEKIGPK